MSTVDRKGRFGNCIWSKNKLQDEMRCGERGEGSAAQWGTREQVSGGCRRSLIPTGRIIRLQRKLESHISSMRYFLCSVLVSPKCTLSEGGSTLHHKRGKKRRRGGERQRSKVQGRVEAKAVGAPSGCRSRDDPPLFSLPPSLPLSLSFAARSTMCQAAFVIDPVEA